MLPASGLAAQTAREAPRPIPRLRGPIELDGRLDEPAWEAVSPLPVVQHLPSFGEEPTERTEFRVAYDAEFVYLGAALYDSDPDGILPGPLQRDRLGLSNDWVGIALDTFNDDENILLFATSPTGIRTDVAFSNDGEGEFPLNASWNTFWDAASRRTDEGWFAEIRIPWSSLRFQDRDDHVVMGMTVWRWIARKQESILFPAIPPRWRWAHYKPSQARDVAFRGVERKTPVYVSPYALVGRQEGAEWVTGPDGTDRLTGFREPVREVGLDLKYGLADNLTLDLSVNTDFAQVEADNQQVNLTRFSLFFPEKRLFFQERASAFGFETGGADRVFHSRRIGLVDGEPVRIYGGGRLVGRVGGWEIGFLDMHTAEGRTRASENVGVLRLRRYLLNENSYVGGILTSRIAADGGYNVVYGGDALLRVLGHDYLTLNWVQTFDSERPEGTGALDGSLARIRWERRALEGPLYHLDLSRTGSHYQPGLGFVRRTDQARLGSRLAYGWRPGPSSAVLRHTVGVDGEAYLRNEDGSLETAEVGPEWRTSLKSGLSLALRPRLFVDDLRRPFRIEDEVEVPEGRHTFTTVSADLSTPSGRARRISLGAEAGSYYDGSRLSVRLRPTWDLSPQLELGADYEFDRVRFPSRSQGLDAHIARLRTAFYLNTALSASAFVQYSSAIDGLVANVRLRFNPREGDDLYIVWNEDVRTDPLVPARGGFTDGRTLAVKYRHTLALGF